MDLQLGWLSFFVILTEGSASESARSYKHFQTMDAEQYYGSELKEFLDAEFVRIVKRKVEKHPNTEQAPTKIGSFIVEEGHELTSNPNYNVFQKLRSAETKQQFLDLSDELVRMYMDTSAVRGGAFIVATATWNRYFDEPFLFILKCDFESNIARISDESSLISRVEMAISSRSIKSIQYPYMPEEGILEAGELKIHQASHARYFEDFLKFVAYEKPMPTIIQEQTLGLVQQYMETKWQGEEGEERQQEEQSLEFWAASEKRELQHRWDHEMVVEAASQMIEHRPDLELKLKLAGVSVKGQMSDYGNSVHIAMHNGRYVVMIVGDAFQFEKGISPIELLQPEDLQKVVERISENKPDDDEAPW